MWQKQFYFIQFLLSTTTNAYSRILTLKQKPNTAVDMVLTSATYIKRYVRYVRCLTLCQMFYNNRMAFKLCICKMKTNCQKACFFPVNCLYHITQITCEHYNHWQDGNWWANHEPQLSLSSEWQHMYTAHEINWYHKLKLQKWL